LQRLRGSWGRSDLARGSAVVDRGRVLEFAERLKVDAPRIARLKGVEGKPVDPPGEGVGEVVEKLRGC